MPRPLRSRHCPSGACQANSFNQTGQAPQTTQKTRRGEYDPAAEGREIRGKEGKENHASRKCPQRMRERIRAEAMGRTPFEAHLVVELPGRILDVGSVVDIRLPEGFWWAFLPVPVLPLVECLLQARLSLVKGIVLGFDVVKHIVGVVPASLRRGRVRRDTLWMQPPAHTQRTRSSSGPQSFSCKLDTDLSAQGMHHHRGRGRGMAPLHSR